MLHAAILTGLRILSYEEFPEDEQPPRRIWLNSDALDEHWKRVKARRKSKYGSEAEEPEGEAQENAVSLITRG
jgi:hypothetical protein